MKDGMEPHFLDCVVYFTISDTSRLLQFVDAALQPADLVARLEF